MRRPDRGDTRGPSALAASGRDELPLIVASLDLETRRRGLLGVDPRESFRGIGGSQPALSYHETKEAVRLRPDRGRFVLPARYGLLGDAHIPSEIHAGPSEALAQEPHLFSGQPGCLFDDHAGDQTMELFDMGDRDLVVATTRTTAHLNPDQRDLLQAAFVVAVVLTLGLHRGAALGAFHLFFLQAITRASSVFDRKQMTTAMRSVSTL